MYRTTNDSAYSEGASLGTRKIFITLASPRKIKKINSLFQINIFMLVLTSVKTGVDW